MVSLTGSPLKVLTKKYNRFLYTREASRGKCPRKVPIGLPYDLVCSECIFPSINCLGSTGHPLGKMSFKQTFLTRNFLESGLISWKRASEGFPVECLLSKMKKEHVLAPCLPCTLPNPTYLQYRPLNSSLYRVKQQVQWFSVDGRF